jgi:hypothetical protein
MKKKTKKYLQVLGVVLLLAIVLVYVLASGTLQNSLSNSSPTAGVDSELDASMDSNVTVPVLESDVEIGTDGIVVSVEQQGSGTNTVAIITLKTEVNSIYTVAVPTSIPSPCEAPHALADIASIVPGDKIAVRGKTDAEGRIVPCESEFHQLRIQGVYENTDAGLSFFYKKSPDGYLLKTEGYDLSTDPLFVTGAMIANKKEAEELLSSVEPREFPPTTILRVYRNPEGLPAEEWARANPAETDIERALAAPAEISVGREDAIGYTLDGLYLTDVYVVTYGEYALMIRGEYIEYDSEPFKDIGQLVATISFTP